MNQAAQNLLKAIEGRSAHIAVVGLGYVGLPLARAMVGAGFRVTGFDIDPQKVRMLNAGAPYLKHLGPDLALQLRDSGRFTPTCNEADLAAADAIILCVPTPLDDHQQPDLTYVEQSTRMAARVMKPGTLVSLESTSFPGTTRGICGPILSDNGRRAGEDFFLVFSPEREDPGRSDFHTANTPRLVGGVDDVSTRLGVALYAAAVSQVIEVESAEVAEAAKLLENIYRAVNIALVNELKPVLQDMGIDIWQVIRAAATKPFGFQPFYPGPGLGGHCIPIDPYYLSYKAREFGHVTRFIELAGEINHQMPRYVVERIVHALNEDRKPLNGSRVLVLGIAYKPNVDDIRETPAAEVITLLRERGAIVSYHDPHVAKFPSMRHYRIDLAGVDLTESVLQEADCVVVITNHAAIDWALVASAARLIVDTRDAMARIPGVRARVVKA
jgi:UDP-N-acetyl-D-glucosamine dehydrogenase